MPAPLRGAASRVSLTLFHAPPAELRRKLALGRVGRTQASVRKDRVLPRRQRLDTSPIVSDPRLSFPKKEDGAEGQGRAPAARRDERLTGAGSPRPAEQIGTERTLAFGKARGTGLYRPSSLIHVADAAPYLHDGSVASLEDLLGRARLSADHRGPRGVGPVPGHRYGLAPDDDARADHIAHLQTR